MRKKRPFKDRPAFRIVLEPPVAFGPGKAALLEAVAATGSISAAGRQLGMSYRRAWMLVDEMNRTFKQPLVTAAKGGVAGGGASLTPFGQEMIERYRSMERRVGACVAKDLRAIRAQLAGGPTAG
ncbi:MAG: winged helix-turn-helix domain-containing protein [Gammaproteobacteria bacterium]